MTVTRKLLAESIRVDAASAAGSDEYRFADGKVVHEMSIGELRVQARCKIVSSDEDAKSAWWSSYLAGVVPEVKAPLRGQLRTADLFCGPGGLANGIRQLCAELGVTVTSELIADQDEPATAVYAANHSTRRRWTSSVRSLIDYSISHRSGSAIFTYPPELLDDSLAAGVRGLDLVLAGPPCQGHSNLNNQTRRADPRNDLYLTVPAFAVAAGASACVIENVPSVLNDSTAVVEKAIQLLESEDYIVTHGVLSASGLGWPQTRKRHFLIARRDVAPIPIAAVEAFLRDEPRSLWWAIGHLEDELGDDVMRQVSVLSEENRARVDWLFENDKDDLGLEVRPKSHRAGTTYTAVYGRLRKEAPAPTITTGFMSPGRGRFTHPTRRRVLTPWEAARLQGFPDTYRFIPNPDDPPGRAQLAKWIGDAVPMPLGYAAAISALGNGVPARSQS